MKFSGRLDSGFDAEDGEVTVDGFAGGLGDGSGGGVLGGDEELGAEFLESC